MHNEAERVARWKPVAMPYARAGLTLRQQQMIAKLADACHLMDTLYWHQSDLGGWAVYHVTVNPVMERLFAINGSRWDLADRNTPILGEEPLVPGHELYPFGLPRACNRAVRRGASGEQSGPLQSVDGGALGAA